MSAKEIAGLIERWERSLEIPSIIRGCAYADISTVKETITALRVLAQENAGLNTIAYQRWEIANARIRELEQENERLKARDIEQFATTDQWLKRIAELEAELDGYKAERDALEPNNTALAMANLRLEAALKPFAEYAERIEKERREWFNEGFNLSTWPASVAKGSSPADLPMSWFIAALKAYRGEPAPPSEEPILVAPPDSDPGWHDVVNAIALPASPPEDKT